MKNNFIIKFFLTIFLVFHTILAQNDINKTLTPSLRNYGLITKSWNVNNGLPDDRIYDFIKDKEGFIWIATNQGLARFDGSEFKLFNSQNVKELKDQSYSDIVCGDDNTLFFFNGQAIVKKNKDNIFTTVVSNFVGQGLLPDLAIDSSGSLWIGTFTRGLYKFENNHLLHFGAESGIDAKHISLLVIDHRNELWVGTNDNGIFKCKDDKFFAPFDKRKLPSNELRSLFLDSSERLWIGTNKGLVVFKTLDDSLSQKPKFITSEIIKTIAEDADHNIWLGSTIKEF